MIQKEYLLKGLDCANCAAKIEIAVGKLDGVSEATVNFATETLIVNLKEEYAGDILPKIEKTVHSIESDVTVSEKIKRRSPPKEYLLKGLGCANCAAKIETAVGKSEGVSEASVNFATATLTVRFKDNSVDLLPEIEKIVHSIESHVEVLEKNKRTEFETVKTCRDACCETGAVSESESCESDPEMKCETKFETKSEKSDTKNSGKNSRFSAFQFIDKKRAARIIIGALVYLLGILIHVSHDTTLPLLSNLEIIHGTPVEYIVFIIAYLIIGGDVVYKAVRGILRREFFDENFLMTIATLGAFALGEYTEAVAVMLFYQVGELFQEMAVNRSRKSIYDMMDIRPDYAHKITDSGSGGYETVSPYDIEIGDAILVKPGEKIPLDGTILSGASMLDTSALTGESVPRTVREGDAILSGSINKNGTLTIRVDQLFEESTVSKILDLVENAASKKAPTEKFITRFSRYYTPLVTLAAVLIAVIPPLVLPGATFEDWIYRGLVFLVISCPCALVISVPLSYFGGIGAASKKGILVKGSNYLEGLTQVKTVVFDKTGTLSEGVFDVVRIDRSTGSTLSDDELMTLSAAAESYSNHPIAHSIVKAAEKSGGVVSNVSEHTEYPGLGIKAVFEGKTIAIGNLKLMAQENVSVSDLPEAGSDVETHIYVAVDGIFEGRISISDKIKPDSKDALARLKKSGVEKTVMVTGDTDKVGRAFAADLGLDDVYTEQLPHQKVEALEKIEAETKSVNPKSKVAFVGDGINDAPVLTRADIGIAVGGVGSDAAVEAADVVLMTGDPIQLADAFDIAKKTKSIVYQNIIFALGIKAVFMILGVFGIATMWEAVFADVGVTLLAVLNSMRLLRLK
ncbi:Potassium-transporting ATPase ATP-binding subunit [Methanimicrococcus stummii]|uniref:Potassium-transporting ATPase ATP-binding subunit n=1 Tax=Methanimicrococcus stummii TaxID=3028294 RepID=A0AA96VAQ6_9EURY|nr:heavy metal translocating P-type ATPase [Methanimicrococcus sp. Es2]WNY28398.1 Potassium-transporting ATPase ATP-binding subunit [Methanimicrococcus sp. Es2]